MTGGLCAGCGRAVTSQALHCGHCGRIVPGQQSAASIPPLPILGTIGASFVATRPVAAAGSADGVAGPPSASREQHRRRWALPLAVPAVLCAGGAWWQWWTHRRVTLPVVAPAALAVGCLVALVILLVLPKALPPKVSAPAHLAAASGALGRAASAPGAARPIAAPRSAVGSESAPGPISTVPGVRAVREPPASRPTGLGVVPPVYQVALDDGRKISLDRPALFGRSPVGTSAERGVQLVAVADRTRTVSKTHVRLDAGDTGVLVTDRHSTNGVVVTTGGVAVRCLAGQPVVAAVGSVIRFGDSEMQVR